MSSNINVNIDFSVERFKIEINSSGLNLDFDAINALICEKIYNLRTRDAGYKKQLDLIYTVTGQGEATLMSLAEGIKAPYIKILEYQANTLGIDYRDIMYNLYQNLLWINDGAERNVFNSLRFVLDLEDYELKAISCVLNDFLAKSNAVYEANALVRMKRRGIDTVTMLSRVEQFIECDCDSAELIGWLVKNRPLISKEEEDDDDDAKANKEYDDAVREDLKENTEWRNDGVVPHHP